MKNKKNNARYKVKNRFKVLFINLDSKYNSIKTIKDKDTIYFNLSYRKSNEEAIFVLWVL